MKWKTVRIFISSTFNDMHAERDFLVKYVFPELSAWCRERRINLVDIDLRWGVSSEDSTANNTVMACLSNIDESRPFFLCFLGQRRGWIPASEDISGYTYENYPGIRDYVGSRSVTEMEIEHALLSPMLRLVEGSSFIPQPVSHAMFFFRNNPFDGVTLNDTQLNIYTNEATENPAIADVMLESFKDKIRHRWNVCDYDCRWDTNAVSSELLTEGDGACKGRLTDFTVDGLPLNEYIIEKLKNEIDAEFPDSYPGAVESLLEKDLEQQEQFIIQCAEGFIHREYDIEVLTEYIYSESRKPFILTAEAGLGKTTLLANFVLILAQTYKEITARFCGASDMTSSQLGLWKSVFDEKGLSYREDLEDIKRNLYTLLSQIRGVLVIDGIDQLYNGIDMLSWLPHELPEGLKLIVSLKEDENSRKGIIAASGFSLVHRVKSFSSSDDKMSLINEYLKRYLKHLDGNHMEVICDTKGSDNPLFLKVLLSNLRVFGAFKQLETEISRYGDNPISAFDAVLAGLEQDTSYIKMISSQGFVSLLFGLLASVRQGLTEDEMIFCFKTKYSDIDEESIRSALRIYLRRVRQFTASREGRTDFLYDSFRMAAAKRYRESRIYYHSLLADCFRTICDPLRTGEFRSEEPRALTELVYHLFQSDASLGEDLLCNLIYINARCSACRSWELISDFDMISEPSSYTLRVKNLVIRFSDVFSKYRNSFFSTALSCDFTKAWDVLPTLTGPKYYIRPEQVTLHTYKSESEASSALSLEIKASLSLDRTVAVCVPKHAPFALFSEGVGRLRLIYLSNMLVDEKVIMTDAKRPIDIFASNGGDMIAITFDDETAEIIKLDFNEGTYVASQRVASFNYYLPMLSDGVFAFSNDTLWYQKDMTTIVKRFGEEETLFSLPSEGEVTAIVMDGEFGSLALRTMGGTQVCHIDYNGVSAVKDFPRCEVLSIVNLESRDMAVSLSDGTIRILSIHGEEKGRIDTGIACALLLEVDNELFSISESGHKAFLWDLKDSFKEGEYPELEYNKKISASFNGDGIHIITDQKVLAASIAGKVKGTAFLLTLLFHDDGPVLVFRESSKEISIHLGERYIKLFFDSMKPSFFIIDNELLVFNSVGNMAVVNLTHMTAQRGISEFCPVSLAASKDSYYSVDTAGFLHRYPNPNRMPSISNYMLSSVSLQIYDDLMILSGISANAKAGIESTPYLMLFYRLGDDGSPKLIGERYFHKDRGMFIDSCFDYAKLLLYVFFSTPHFGSAVSLPTVSYGTVDEFISFGEKQVELYFERKNNSFHVFNSTLFVCGGGVISTYDAYTLNYHASITTEGGFRLLIPQGKDALYTISDSGNVIMIQNSI